MFFVTSDFLLSFLFCLSPAVQVFFHTLLQRFGVLLTDVWCDSFGVICIFYSCNLDVFLIFSICLDLPICFQDQLSLLVEAVFFLHVNNKLFNRESVLLLIIDGNNKGLRQWNKTLKCQLIDRSKSILSIEVNPKLWPTKVTERDLTFNGTSINNSLRIWRNQFLDYRYAESIAVLDRDRRQTLFAVYFSTEDVISYILYCMYSRNSKAPCNGVLVNVKSIVTLWVVYLSIIFLNLTLEKCMDMLLTTQKISRDIWSYLFRFARGLNPCSCGEKVVVLVTLVPGINDNDVRKEYMTNYRLVSTRPKQST